MQQRMSAAEYRELKDKPTKYRNRKTVVDGMVFDSQKEADYYCQLKLLKRQGEIIDFFRQVPFMVHEGYHKDGKWIKPIYYVADFLVILADWTPKGNLIEIHEAKGKWTRSAIDKRKMFEKRYPEYELKII